MKIHGLLFAAGITALGTLSGCVASTEPADELDRSASEATAIAEEIAKKYGVRPVDYARVFNASGGNETTFHEALPTTSDFLSGRLEGTSAGYEVEMFEIASTFLTGSRDSVNDQDGESHVIQWGPEPMAMLDEHLYSIVQLLPEDVAKLIATGECVVQGADQDGQLDDVVSCLSFEQTLSASAAVYAWSKSLARDALATRGVTLASLPVEGQIYWATIFSRLGPSRGEAFLQERGAKAWQQRWTKGNDPARYASDPHYNALWRTATAELMLRTVFADEPDTLFPSEPGCVWSPSNLDFYDDRSLVTPDVTVDDNGAGVYRGYISRPDDIDWTAASVKEVSYDAGMCIFAIVDQPDYFRLCAAYDGPVDTSVCADATGALLFDVDRAAKDDSGTLYLSVAPIGDVDECRGYQVNWSIRVDPCICIAADCPAKMEE